MIRAVLFDMDGVLIDSYDVWFNLMNAACREFGVRAISREEFRGAWGQGIEEDVRRYYTNKTAGEVEVYYNAHFMDHVEHMRVDPGAGDLLTALRRTGVKTGLITNTPGPLAGQIIRRAGLSLDVIVGSTDVNSPKPAPDMVVRACELLRVEIGEIIVVGDSRYDLDAARAAGARFAGLGIEGDHNLERLIDLLDALAPELTG